MTLLGMPYSNHMPLVPRRTFALSIPGMPTHGPPNWPGDHFSMTFMDELVAAELGEVGTQWDGLAHPMMRVEGVEGCKDGDYFYNKKRPQDVGTPRGMKVNGTEQAGGFFTRGMLIDIAELKGVKILPKGYAITPADYKEALKKQGIGDATKGDVVLFRTGWTALWKTNHLGRPAGEKVKSDEQMAKDSAAFTSGEPQRVPRGLRLPGGKENLHDRFRYLGRGAVRLRQGWRARIVRLLSHEPDCTPWHIQLRKPGPGRPVRRQSLRIPVRMGAVEAGRCHRLSRQPGCCLRIFQPLQ